MHATVDSFHFKTHIGAYCMKYTNPNRIAILREGKGTARNMSVAEQGFKHTNKYKYSFNKMNYVKFGFILLHMTALLNERS